MRKGRPKQSKQEVESFMVLMLPDDPRIFAQKIMTASPQDRSALCDPAVLNDKSGAELFRRHLVESIIRCAHTGCYC
jgi:hypothetical protein